MFPELKSDEFKQVILKSPVFLCDKIKRYYTYLPGNKSSLK